MVCHGSDMELVKQTCDCECLWCLSVNCDEMWVWRLIKTFSATTEAPLRKMPLTFKNSQNQKTAVMLCNYQV